MNRRQKIVVMIGVAVVALMLLVPPWHARNSTFTPGRTPTEYGTLGFVDTSGYAPLFAPPEGQRQLDITRLGLQLAVVAVLTFGAYVVLGHRKEI